MAASACVTSVIVTYAFILLFMLPSSESKPRVNGLALDQNDAIQLSKNKNSSESTFCFSGRHGSLPEPGDCQAQVHISLERRPPVDSIVQMVNGPHGVRDVLANHSLVGGHMGQAISGFQLGSQWLLFQEGNTPPWLRSSRSHQHLTRTLSPMMDPTYTPFKSRSMVIRCLEPQTPTISTKGARQRMSLRLVAKRIKWFYFHMLSLPVWSRWVAAIVGWEPQTPPGIKKGAFATCPKPQTPTSSIKGAIGAVASCSYRSVMVSVAVTEDGFSPQSPWFGSANIAQPHPSI